MSLHSFSQGYKYRFVWLSEEFPIPTKLQAVVNTLKDCFEVFGRLKSIFIRKTTWLSHWVNAWISNSLTLTSLKSTYSVWKFSKHTGIICLLLLSDQPWIAGYWKFVTSGECRKILISNFLLNLKQNLLELTRGRLIQWHCRCDLFSTNQVQIPNKSLSPLRVFPLFFPEFATGFLRIASETYSLHVY